MLSLKYFVNFQLILTVIMEKGNNFKYVKLNDEINNIYNKTIFDYYANVNLHTFYRNINT